MVREQLHESQFDKNMGTAFTREDYQGVSWTTRDHREERETETVGRLTFEQVLVNWDTHIDYLLSKASSRLYIIKIYN